MAESAEFVGIGSELPADRSTSIRIARSPRLPIPAADCTDSYTREPRAFSLRVDPLGTRARTGLASRDSTAIRTSYIDSVSIRIVPDRG